MGTKWIGAGFAAFGLLVGLVCGLSEAKVTTTLLGLLFALIGGSLGALLGKLDDDGRKITGIALLTFSLCAMPAILGGITIRINDLLRTGSPRAQGSTTGAQPASAGAYLQANETELIKFLTLEIGRERMALPQACEVLQKEGNAATRR